MDLLILLINLNSEVFVFVKICFVKVERESYEEFCKKKVKIDVKI